MPRDTRFTCATAGLWTDDRTAGASKHHLSAVALDTAVLRLRRRRRGDDRIALDRRGDVVPGAKREARRGRVDHGASGGARCGGDEDGRDWRSLLLYKS